MNVHLHTMSDEKPMKLNIRVFRVEDTTEMGPAMGIEEERGHVLWSMAHESLKEFQDVLEATEYMSSVCLNVQELAFVCLCIGRWWRENEIATAFSAKQKHDFDQIFKKGH